MSKKWTDYVLYSLKNDKSNKKKRQEEAIRRAKSNQFNKAFSDKTYTVAKKMLDNVEKVADYDYDALFDRVNKSLGDALPKVTRTITEAERQARSREFDKKFEEKEGLHPNDFRSTDGKYRDEIIKKTAEHVEKQQGKEIDKEQSQPIEVPEVPLVQETDNSMEAAPPLDEHLEEIIDDVSEVIEEVTVEETDIQSEALSPEDTITFEEHVIEEDVESVEEKVAVSPIINEPLAQETMVEEIQPEIEHAFEPGEAANSIKVDLESPKEEKTKYSKEELKKQKRYHKKKNNFKKSLKVELDDSIIGQQRRSFRRLFKFSLSFKLSFVFMLLIIATVVSLSVAFYLGIDFVLELKDSGRMDDVAFFKDVLIVLLIIFDMVAIILCISFGTKASRELVTPIDEMTQIVRTINAKDMDRRLNVKGMHDELKELAMTFNEMLDRIENSYETQNRFTSDASHELRTPIAVIQGYINMLDRWGKADEEILEESIEAIKSESTNMKRLTEKLLLLAKADKGILEMEFKPFPLNELISEITKETSMITKTHTIKNSINDVKIINADRESLKQAIRIFVDNAVKYTPENGIVSINSYINKHKIYVEIEDNGIGISKEDMANIFNRFYRVDKSRTKDSGGHGLGLSIAKWIINQHKGEILVNSEVDKGTRITLIFSSMNNG